MLYVLHCVVIVVDEPSCCWPVSQVQTSRYSTTNDSFDAMSIIRRREAPNTRQWTRRAVWQARRILQCLVVHAVAAQYSDDVQ